MQVPNRRNCHMPGTEKIFNKLKAEQNLIES